MDLPILDDQIQDSLSWIEKSHTAVKCTGSSAQSFYTLFGTYWDGPYPETTGYIVETLLNLSRSEIVDYNSRKKSREMSENMTRWLLELQNPDGSFPGGVLRNAAGENAPIVFNVGQILVGLNAFYINREKCQDKILNKRVKAAIENTCNWLTMVQRSDGAWEKYTYLSKPTTYHSRVSWPLAQASLLLGNSEWRSSAEKFVAYFRSCLEKETKWPVLSDFRDEYTSVLHTLIYSMRGFLETVLLVEDPESVRIAIEQGERLMKCFEIHRKLPSYLCKWKPVSKQLCITGLFQASIYFFRLFKITGDLRFANAGFKALDLGRKYQWRSGPNRGGYPGSVPYWGKYKPLSFPNWAVKFFLDAAIESISTAKEIARRKSS
jgi:hypothetical protein